MKLIIVESPTKARTIKKFVNQKEFDVASCYGHIRDLPKSKFGIDVENNFEPKYVIPIKAGKVIKELKTKMQKAEEVILATDEDREGESISWHLKEVLELKNYKRITFHEITKEAILQALENPREILLNLVEAQKARRVLDRIVGYKLSPFLWKKVARKLSAGRVQSVALRLIVEREKEIKDFKPQEYWTIDAQFQKLIESEKENKNIITATLFKIKGEQIDKFFVKNQKEAERIKNSAENKSYKIAKVDVKRVKRYPLPPFITSTLQQTAAQKLNYPAKLTMSIAQKLYEMGFITYHRTDSFNLSSQAIYSARNFIKENIGEKYLPEKPFIFKSKSKTAQEAHEAIRPTYIQNTPGKVQNKLDTKSFKLYKLIWERFLACQMKEAEIEQTILEIESDDKEFSFKGSGQTIIFDGFIKIYPIETKENLLPKLQKEEELKIIKIDSKQHFTQPPPRYTEASLIKELEKNEIGRPSTYATIVSIIQERGYVTKENNKFFKPTELGIAVNTILVENFPKIVDVKFTADMENNLDEIANGQKKYIEVIKPFYEYLEKELQEKYKKVKKVNLTQKTDIKCPLCKSDIVIRIGKFGKFYACSNFPNCKFTKDIEKIEVKCPKCGIGKIVKRINKKRKNIFYGCSNYPKCDFIVNEKPTGEKCEKCGSLMVEAKNGKIKCSNKDCESNKSKQLNT